MGELVLHGGDLDGWVVGGPVNDVHGNPARSPCLGGRQRGEVDRLRLDGGRAVLVLSGEQQKVAGQSLQAGFLGQRRVGDGRPVGAVGLAARHFEAGPDGGDGAAQLVRRVGDELPLPGCGRVQAAEHGVHGAGEAPDLVACGRFGTRRCVVDPVISSTRPDAGRR
jgi:hypothetical protein